MKITFIFSCSGMFWNVAECSMFRVLSTPVNYKEKELDLIINLPHLVPQVTVD